MTTSIALFDCPHCIDEFAFDYQKIAKLNYGWRVRVRCPGCGNIIEVVMLAYTLIHGCNPDKYEPGEIVEILPPDPKAGDCWMSANTVRRKILQKKSGWQPQGSQPGSRHQIPFTIAVRANRHLSSDTFQWSKSYATEKKIGIEHDQQSPMKL